MRETAMEKTRQALERLCHRVTSGRLKEAPKIGEAAARILSRNHGSRYFGWKLEQGIFRYFEHPRHLEPEKALEGKYVIQSVGEQNRRGVTAGNHQARQILAALGITDREP